MKTQLLEDFDESGSAAQARQAAQDAPAPQADVSAPPGAADPSWLDQTLVAPNAAPSAPAAVWQRPQAHLAADEPTIPAGQSMQGAGGEETVHGTFAGQMRPPDAEVRYGASAQRPEQAGQAHQRAPEGAWAGPRPVPPEARVDGRTPEQAHAHADVHARTHAHAGAQAAHDLPPPAEPATTPHAMPDHAPTADTDIPDWLAERLRADAEQEARRQRSRLTTRRAFAWSAAATVVAMLAVTAYWFYQENEVEGALHVVAKTSPAPARSPAAPGAGRAAVLPSAAQPAAQDTPATTAETTAPEAQVPVDTWVENQAAPRANSRANSRAESQGAAPSAPSAPDATASAAQPPAAAAQPPAPVAEPPAAAIQPPAPAAQSPASAASTATPARGQVTHKRARHTRHDATLANIDGPLRPAGAGGHPKRSAPEPAPRPVAAAHPSDEPTPAQRREETLMQCRVLGYDERECTRRGCMMTRFGLACPG